MSSNVMVMAPEAEAYDCSQQSGGGKKIVVVRLAASNSSASFEHQPDIWCASGPANERQQPPLEASGVSFSPAVEGCEEAAKEDEDEDEEEEGEATNLSESFSFNSYQGIVCNGSSFFAGSTFAASDCKRLALSSASPATLKLATTTNSNNGDSCKTRQTSSTKLRVHSRHGSICSQQQLISSGEKVQVKLEKNSPEAEETLSRWPANETHQQVFGRRKIVQFKQQLSSASSQRKASSSLSCVRVLARTKEEEEEEEANNMSQTLQSIQSLSMQLNRAASLNRSTSQLEEIIHPHQVVEANPLVDHHHYHSAFDGAMNESSISSGFAQTTTTTTSSIINNNSGNDSAANKFSRLVGKKATRVKEILLQNLGKADKTTDELFEFYEENFYKQQSQAVKLQKEFKSYINSLKGAQEAGKNLNCCIQQSTGDYQSARHDLVCENLSQLEHLNEDLMEKLRNQISNNINEYLAQFTELREKISKRRRKLIDYDSSRRVYETMLAAANKRRQQQQQQQVNANGQQQQQQIGARSLRSAFFLGNNSVGGGGTNNNNNQEIGDTQQSLQLATNQLISEARLLKLQEQYNFCKILYETINSELHEELPMVYEKKMKHLLMTLQNYFAIEAQFHSNAGKLYSTASDVIDELPMSYPSRQRAKFNQSQISHNTEVSNQVNEEGDEEEGGEEDEEEEDNDDQEVEYPGRGGVVTTTASGGKSCVVVATSGSSTSGMGSSRGESSVESSSSSSNSDAEHDSSVAGSPTGDDMRPTQQQQQIELSGVANNNINNNNDDDEQQQSERKDSTVIVEQQIVVDDAGVGVVVVEEEAGTAAGKGSGGALAVVSSRDEEEEEAEAGQQSVDCAREDVGNGEKNNSNSNNNNSREQASDDVKKVDVDDKTKIDQVIEGELVCVMKPVKKGDDQATLNQAAANSCSSINNKNKNQSAASGGCLYKVKTSYKYLAEDVDELCFEADEIIQVVEFDETQEQEEGWLMGIREVNGQRGLFPANFTQPI